MKLRIRQISVGPLQMNATLVMDKKTKDTIFFDPGDETERILEVAKNEGMNITRLIATHPACSLSGLCFWMSKCIIFGSLLRNLNFWTTRSDPSRRDSMKVLCAALSI